MDSIVKYEMSPHLTIWEHGLNVARWLLPGPLDWLIDWFFHAFALTALRSFPKEISTLTAVGSWLNENKEDATTIRDRHRWERQAEMSGHLPSSTDNTVAIRSQFLFNKPRKCAPRPPALPITSMSAVLGRRGEEGWQQWLPCRRGMPPSSVSHAAEGWSSVATHRRMLTLPPLQVAHASSFTCDTAAAMTNSGFYILRLVR